MKIQSRILSVIAIVPALLSSSVWAAEKSRDAFLITTDGSIVRSASGECVRTPAWNAAAATDCTAATRAAAPAAPVAKIEAVSKPAAESTSAAAPAAVTTPVIAVIPAPVPAVAATPAVAPAPAAPEPPVVAIVPAVKVAAPISLSGAALFEFNRAELKPGAQKQLSDLAGKVKSQKELDELVITGYADATGPEIYNEALSKKRAESVKDFLLQQGVVSKRVVIQALGEEKPVASNDTPEGRAQNRRVEVSIKSTSTK